MTDSERIDLQRSTVARIKATNARSRAATARKSKRQTSRSRVAARYAHMFRTSLTEAAVVFDLCRSSVRDAWHRLYPNVPGRRSWRPL